MSDNNRPDERTISDIGLRRRTLVKSTAALPMVFYASAVEDNNSTTAAEDVSTDQIAGIGQEVTIYPHDDDDGDVSFIEGVATPVVITVEGNKGYISLDDEFENSELHVTVENADIVGDPTTDEEYEYLEGEEAANELHFEADTFDARAHHSVSVVVEPTSDDDVEVTAETYADGDKEDDTSVEYEVREDELSWEFFATTAAQRAELLDHFHESYEATVAHEPWEETVTDATIDVMTTLTVAKAQSLALGGAGQVFGVTGEVANWIDVESTTYGLISGVENTTIGDVILRVSELHHDFIDHTHSGSADCAGESDKALEELRYLCEDEQDAWKERDRTAVVDLLEEQYETAFNTTTGSFSLFREARAQKRYRANIGRACDGNPFPVSSLDDDIRRFFDTLYDFAMDEAQSIDETLRFVRPPVPSVSTERHHGKIANALGELADQGSGHVDVTFHVSNDSDGGITSDEGYLSISYSEALETEVLTDDFDEYLFESGDTILDDEGQEIDAEYPLLDVADQYQPGDERECVVRFNLADDANDVNESDLWIQYRGAFRPVLLDDTLDPDDAEDAKARQEEFARTPANGNDTDQQGWAVYRVTGKEVPHPPRASIDTDDRIEPGEMITLDASGSTADGDIDNYEWEIDTDGDGAFDTTESDVEVDMSFDDPGTKRVRLTVEDEHGETDSVETAIEVEYVAELLASFRTSPSTVKPNDEIEFTATVDADSYDWEIDGDEFSGETVTTSFAESGDYEVTLEVSRDGESDELTSEVTIETIEERLGEPRARLDIPGTLEEGETGTFDASDSYHPDPEIDVVDWEWTIRDEVYTREEVTHSFEETGEYDISLIVTDTGGETDSAVNSLVVEDGPPDDKDKKFELELQSGPGEVVEGNLVEFTINIINTGSGDGEQEIIADVPEIGTDTAKIELDPGESKTLSSDDLSIEAKPDETGTYDLIIDSDDDQVQSSFRVIHPREKWSFKTDGPIQSSPTIVDGIVYFGSDDGYIYAINVDDGSEVWAVETDGSVRSSSPTVVDETVFVGSTDGNLYALNAGDGSIRWTYDTDGFLDTSPTVAGGAVFITGSLFGSEDVVTALDTSDGSVRWEFEAKDKVRGHPTVMNDTVFVGSNDQHLYAIDVQDGTVRWSFETGDAIYDVAPTVAKGKVVVGSSDEYVYALDITDGGLVWGTDTSTIFPQGGGAVLSSPTVFDGTVFVGANDGLVHALRIGDGSHQWVYDVGEWINSSPTVVGETVYFGGNTGQIYSVDASEGELNWSVQTGGEIESSPTIHDGTLYVGSEDGRLYAIETDVDQSSQGSRVQLGSLGHHEEWNGTPSVTAVDIAGQGDTAKLAEGTQEDVLVNVTNTQTKDRKITVDFIIKYAEIDDVNVLTDTVETGELSPGETEQIRFDDVTADLDPTEYFVQVVADDGATATGKISIKQGESSIALAQLDIDGQGDDARIKKDQNAITITAEATNLDDNNAKTNIRLAFPESEIEGFAQSIELDAGETQSVQFEDVSLSPFSIDREYFVEVTDEDESVIGQMNLTLPAIVGDEPPQDLTENSLYEDINGDGSADIVDVQALHRNLDSDAVQDHSELFNFSEENPDEVTEVDIQALYELVTGGEDDA